MADIINFRDKIVELTDDPEVVQRAIEEQTQEILETIQNVVSIIENILNRINELEMKSNDKDINKYLKQ